jgi:protein TonB
MVPFYPPDPAKMNHASLKDFAQTFEVSLKTPKKADFLANSNQLGSGSKKEKSRLTSPFASPNPNNENGEDVLKSEKSTPDVVHKPEPKLLTTKGKTNKHVENKPEKEEVPDPTLADKDISEQTEEIAQLMAEMSKQEAHYAKRPRIHFLDSISAKSAVEADYINNWSKKLERIGNINFPKKAIQLSLSGTLILNATLDRAGRVVEMQISVSSGSKILDKAALRIVKLAAPYQPLPKEIREKYDRLNITRTIIFQKKGGKAMFYSK